MKVLVLGSRKIGTENDSAEIAAQIGADFVLFENLIFDIETNNVKVYNGDVNILENGYDLVLCFGWLRDKEKEYAIFYDVAYSLAQLFDHHGIKYWNSEMGRQRSTSKLSQMVIMALNGILIPHTYYSITGELLQNRLEGKYIVKAAAASRGRDNFLLESSELAGFFEERKDIPANIFLLQNYIENDHDLRVICFGCEPYLALKRSRTDDSTHLNNTSQGGTGTWIDLTDEVRNKARKVAKLFGRDMGGIDFLEYTDHNGDPQLYCLEANVIPQLTSGFDKERKMDALRRALQDLGKD